MTLKSRIKTTEVDDNVTTVENLAERDWSRDNLNERFSEVRSAHEDIDNRLQKKVEKFGSIPDPEDFLDSWSSWLDQRGTSTDLQMVGNKDAVPGAAVSAWNESLVLLVDYLVLQSELEELEWFALKKFKTEFNELLEEYRLAKSYDTIQDALDDKAENWVVEKTEDKIQRMESMVKEFEKFEQARLEERKADRQAFREVARQATGVDEDKVEELADAAREKIEHFLDENGILELDPDKIEDVRKRKSRDEAADSSAEQFADEGGRDNDDGFSGITLKDKTSIEERADALAKLADELEPQVNDLSQDEIAEYTDMTRQAIFGTNGVLQKCHNNDLFPGIDV